MIKDGGDVEVIDFNHEPMAAASIGQVHRATVKRRVTKGNSVGTTRGGASDEEHEFETLDVCMKIQYPGVARSDPQRHRQLGEDDFVHRLDSGWVVRGARGT